MNSSFRSYLVNFAIFPRKLECKDRGGNVRVNYWFDTLLDMFTRQLRVAVRGRLLQIGLKSVRPPLFENR